MWLISAACKALTLLSMLGICITEIRIQRFPLKNQQNYVPVTSDANPKVAIRIIEGVAATDVKLSSWNEDAHRERLNLVKGPNGITSLADSCLSYNETSHAEFYICPFRNVTFGELSKGRARTSGGVAIDETLAGRYTGWGKILGSPMCAKRIPEVLSGKSSSGVMPLIVGSETGTSAVPNDIGTVNSDSGSSSSTTIVSNVNTEVPVSPGIEQCMSTEEADKHIQIVQVYDNGGYCQMGDVFTAVVEFQCLSVKEEITETLEESTEADIEHQSDALNSETLLDGDSEKEEIIEITEFTETYRVLHAERGSFYRTSSRGAWHLHSWIPDEKGCTYRVLLQVPLPCSALPLTLDSDLLTAYATAARSGDLVDSQVSNLLGMWEQWGVLVDDLYQPASTDSLPVTPPSSGPEFSHAHVTTSTPHTEANGVQQSEGTLNSNAVLLRNDESTEPGTSNTQECTCCAELSALKAKLRAISESKMTED